MRLTISAFLLATSLVPALSSAQVKQITIGARAAPEGPCEIQTRHETGFLPGETVARKTQTDCAVSAPKTVFFEQYEYCALSGIKEYNDDRFSLEHDFGSHCSFEIDETEVTFKASRGFGFSESSTSALFCSFTCIEKGVDAMKTGTDLDVITSEPLPPIE